jgi:dTDP-4-dehydrorhamnose 3,5-epimerase
MGSSPDSGLDRRTVPTRPTSVQFKPAPLAGAFTIDLELKGDARGFFARLFCEEEFAAAGLESRFKQMNNTLSSTKGTLRGMHYQLPPFAEVKVVRCLRGSLYDVIVDLRPDSASFGKWFGAVLSAENRRMMYVPRGFAHGLLTLADDTEVLYLMGERHAPDRERGLRHDDPWMSIKWPMHPVEMSGKDQAWPLFDPDWHGVDLMRGMA